MTDLLRGSGFDALVIAESPDEDASVVLRGISLRFNETGGIACSTDSWSNLDSLVTRFAGVFGASRVAVLGNKVTDLLERSVQSSILSNVTWMDLNTPSLPKDLSGYGSGFKVYSLAPKIVDSEEVDRLKIYLSQWDKTLTFEYASTYDAARLYVMFFIHLQEWRDPLAVEKIIEYSQGYVGLTGDCSLNAHGDRDHLSYELSLVSSG
jgi:hypothetical protein